MLSVLHLWGADPDFQTSQTVSVLEKQLSGRVQFTSRKIGNATPVRNLMWAGWSLKQGRFGQPDVIHAWDQQGFFAATMARIAPVVFSAGVAPIRRPRRMLGVMGAWPGVHWVWASESDRSGWGRWGVGRGQCVMAPPIDMTLMGAADCSSTGVSPVSFPQDNHSRDGCATTGSKPEIRNESLRRELGFAPEDYVLLAPGESTLLAGHRLALWAASILHVLDGRTRLLVWGRGEGIEPCRWLAERLKQPKVLTIAQEKLGRRVEFADLVGVSDAALITPAGPIPMLPTAMCMAGGIPIVASPGAGELLSASTVWISASASPRHLSQALLALRQTPPEQVQARVKSAQERALTACDAKACAAGYLELYRIACAAKVGVA